MKKRARRRVEWISQLEGISHHTGNVTPRGAPGRVRTDPQHWPWLFPNCILRYCKQRLHIDSEQKCLNIDTYCSPIPFSASSRLHRLKMCFCTFPLAVFGSSFGVPSSPTNQTHAGAFYVDSHSWSLGRREYAPAGSCSPIRSSLRTLGTSLYQPLV